MTTVRDAAEMRLQAQIERDEAAATNLPMVRIRALAAAASWDKLAKRTEEADARRAIREAQLSALRPRGT